MIAMNKTNNTKPVIGISMGDPAGIGPEIIVKALSSAEVYAACRPVVVGDAGVMRQAVQLLGKDVKFIRSSHSGGSLGTAPIECDMICITLI